MKVTFLDIRKLLVGEKNGSLKQNKKGMFNSQI